MCYLHSINDKTHLAEVRDLLRVSKPVKQQNQMQIMGPERTAAFLSSSWQHRLSWQQRTMTLKPIPSFKMVPNCHLVLERSCKPEAAMNEADLVPYSIKPAVKLE